MLVRLAHLGLSKFSFLGMKREKFITEATNLQFFYLKFLGFEMAFYELALDGPFVASAVGHNNNLAKNTQSERDFFK